MINSAVECARFGTTRDIINATTMQTARESSRQKRCNKRRNSRKKSLSPSDLKCTRGDVKTDNKLNGKRSLSEGSVKVKHRKSNIRRTLTHPFTCSDDIRDVSMIGVFNCDVKVDPPPESDESNLPPTSSDRDTEDDGRLSRPAPQRSRWDSGSEMDSLVSTVVRRASARRRRTPANPEWGVNCEPGEASEPEAGRMRPEDYRLVFLSSDSSCREDTEDSSSTASSAAPPAPDDCDWDYFEPGASAAPPVPPPTKHAPQACPRPCSCGAEPRIVAVPVPVPVPVPAALWPALLAFPTQTPPAPHWNTYPGFPPLDAAALARLTTAAAVAVTAAATATASAAASPQTNKLEMTTVERTDKAIQSESSQAPEPHDNDNNDKNIERPVENETSVGIKVIAEEDSLSSLSSDQANAMPDHLDAEKAFPSSNESAESSDSEQGVARRSYDLTSGAPEEPATSDEDSDDSGGGGGGRFSRVFVVNPADSSSDLEDNADSSGIDCDDSYDKKSDSLEIIAVEVPRENEVNVSAEPNESASRSRDNSSIVLLDSVNFTEEYSVIPYENNSDEDSNDGGIKKSNFFKFCDENMLQSETCEKYNSFNASCSSSSSNDLDKKHHADSDVNRYQSISSENTDFDSLADSFNNDSDMKVKFSVELTNENNKELSSLEIPPDSLTKLAPSPEPCHDNTSSSPAEKIDLFKGIERTLSELFKKELMEDQEEEKMHSVRPVCSDAEGGACAPAATTVCRSRTARADGSARFTSRVMITHDRVSVVTSDTTRLMRDVVVHHTNSQSESEPNPDVPQDEIDERISDDETPQPSGGVTVVSNADTLSAVVCLEEGLADDDSWVEDVSHNEDEATSPSDTDSGDEASLPIRGEEFAYCRRSIDFTLHTIVEESCEESETEQTIKKPRPISATELEKYFFFGLGDGRNVRDDEDAVSETSSVCSEGGESIVDSEQPKRSGDSDELVSSRLEKYFLSGFMGFNQERRDSDGSGSVGSDSEGRQSPEQRRKRLVRARGTPRSHSSSLDNLLTGEEPSQDNPEVSDGSSTETEDRHDSSERLDMQGESKRKKQNKKPRGSPADERRQSAEFTEETRDDTRSVSEGEDGRLSPRPEFPPLGSELSESKKQTSRDSGFVGSCDDLLRNGDSSSEFARSHEPKIELEEIIEEIRPDIEERVEGPPSSRPPQSPLVRKDSFNNWSSDEETNLMMTKMRQFFKQMVHTTNVRTSTPASASSNSESSRPPKPPQLLYFESELTRLMKTVPGIRDEEVREIVEYLSSEDTWSDSYDSSDYAGSDLEGTAANRSALRKQISDSCREIIDEFDRGNNDAGSLERDAVGAYRRLAQTLGRAGEGSPPMFGKVMRHIGGRLVALMHEVSGGASPSTDEDSASEPGALARSRSHDILEATASRGSVASDCERFSWRGSFESALLAADSRGTLGGGGCESRRSPAGADLAAQKSHSRSCGAIGGSEDRLWRGRRRASAPDAESEEEQRAGSLPRLPSITGTNTVPAGPVKSARYRAPGFRTATRAASAPGLHAPRRRRPPPTPLQPPPAAPASAPSLQDEVYLSDAASPNHATLPRRSNSPLPHERDLLDRDRYSLNRSGLQARSESMASVYSGAGEGTRANVTVRGEVQISLLYNYRLGALEVGVKRCRELAPVDVKRNRSDPYVKVYLLPDKSKAGKRKTKVKKNTLNPVFEETLSFVQPLASLSARTLWLSVWHADMFGRNDFLGEVTLPLADVVFDDPAPMWYKLHERTEQFDEQQGSRGDLIVALKLDLHEGARGKGTLHVLVKEAKNLVATKPNGLADVFCKSYLLPERGRLAKQKTAVCRRTLNPKWEHTFTYRGLTLQELSARALELSLWDRDRLASNDFMGAIRLSLGTYMGAPVNWMDSVGKEVSLWQMMMQRPNFWVEGSFPLRPHLNN
ncbi:bitesize isoform X2 [Anticarsia gemmatalis]|uniref:bitesize isoform X2 n=1 Tax=Anticarsia gemmatalis TaxID=129554 RepID=UPI003F75F38A